MKKVIVLLLVASLVLTGCNHKATESDTDIKSGETQNENTVGPDTENAGENETLRNVAVITDFSKRKDPPLVKKFSMFNSGLVPIKNYERDIDAITDIYSDSLRIDVGLGSKNFALERTVDGSIDDIKYDFKDIDYLAEMLNARKVLPYISWTYIPIPVQTSYDSRKLPVSLEKYKEILSTLARHFKESGIRIGYHEIYNEPDLDGVFFDGTFEEYMDLYRYGSLGILEGDPDAVIGGPALASPERVENTNAFLQMVVEENLPLDYFSYHHYWLNSSFKQKHNIVKNALSRYDRLKTAEVHLNEVAYINGWLPGDDSINNFYNIAPKIFKMFDDMLSEPDITVASWAQFLESTVVGDAYGMIFRDGTKKALYNVFKIYADLPVERVDVQSSNPVIDGMASYDESKAAIVLWNTGTEKCRLKIELNNLPFDPAEARLYRIDSNNASAFNGAPEDLMVCEVWDNFEGGRLPEITIDPEATVYITVVEDKNISDFDPESKYVDFAEDIRLHYYFEDRYKNNYAFIDRKSWRADLGMGENIIAYSVAGATFEELPEVIKIITRSSGEMSFKDDNAYIGVRIDFYDGEEYVSSTAFCPQDFKTRKRSLSWGTKREVDKTVVIENFDEFEIIINDYLPENATKKRAIVTFEMENTGPGTSMVFKLNKK